MRLYSVAAVERHSATLHVGTVRADDEAAAIIQFTLDITRKRGLVGLIAADAVEVNDEVIWNEVIGRDWG